MSRAWARAIVRDKIKVRFIVGLGLELRQVLSLG
jgi:hypothetical protein